MNVVMNDSGQFIEVQGTAEGHPFSHDELLANPDSVYAKLYALQAFERETDHDAAAGNASMPAKQEAGAR